MLDLVPFVIVGAGVLQLPLLMDLVSYLFPHSRVGRAVTRAMRYLLVSSLVMIVTAALYLHLTVLLREHVADYANLLPDGDESESAHWATQPKAIAHILFSVYVYMQLLSHFFDACHTPPSRARSDAHLRSPSPSGADDEAEVDGQKTRWCSSCGVPKLLRTHHCRNCNTCVELMDHHCPFTGSCVSLTSFRSFYLWLVFGTVGITYACYISFLPFKHCWYDALGGAAAKEVWRVEHGALCARLGRASYLFLPTFFGWLSTLFIFGFQTALLRADVTTIEYLTGLTQMKLRIRTPEEVARDAHQRLQATGGAGGDSDGGSARRRRNAGAATDQEAELFEHEDQLRYGQSASLMESGSPVSSASSPAIGIVGSPSFAYNPHKSFRLLVLKHHPVWTLFVPPLLLRLLRRSRRRTHPIGRREQSGPVNGVPRNNLRSSTGMLLVALCLLATPISLLAADATTTLTPGVMSEVTEDALLHDALAASVLDAPIFSQRDRDVLASYGHTKPQAPSSLSDLTRATTSPPPTVVAAAAATGATQKGGVTSSAPLHATSFPSSAPPPVYLPDDDDLIEETFFPRIDSEPTMSAQAEEEMQHASEAPPPHYSGEHVRDPTGVDGTLESIPRPSPPAGPPHPFDLLALFDLPSLFARIWFDLSEVDDVIQATVATLARSWKPSTDFIKSTISSTYGSAAGRRQAEFVRSQSPAAATMSLSVKTQEIQIYMALAGIVCILVLALCICSAWTRYKPVIQALAEYQLPEHK